MKRLFLWTLGILTTLFSYGQTVVTIGTASDSTTTAPLTGSGGNTTRYSQHVSIFTAAEVGMAGNITHIAWNKTNAAGYTNNNGTLNIYLAHKSSGSTVSTTGGSFATEVAAATLVYSSTTQGFPAASGWQTLQLATPFNYDGVSDLEVLVDWYRPTNVGGPGVTPLRWFYTLNAGLGGTFTGGNANPTQFSNFTAGFRPNIQLTFAMPQACTPVYTGGTSLGDFIDGVQLNTLSNTSTGGITAPSYTDYANTFSTNVRQTMPYTLVVTGGTNAGTVAAWIDYNQDGTLDTTEKIGEVAVAAAGSVATITFTPPTTAILGKTRLRVREVAGTQTNLDPCASYADGETEDYSVVIQSAPVNDVKLIGFSAPKTGGCFSATETVAVKVTNIGGIDIVLATTPVNVSVSVAGPNPTTLSGSVAAVSGIFAAGDTATVTLSTTYDMTAAGTYAFVGGTAFSLDAVVANDSASLSVVNVAPLTFPIAAVPFTGYTGANLGTVYTSWAEGKGASAPSGTTSNWLSRNFGNVNPGPGGTGNTSASINLNGNTNNEWIVSPRIDLSAGAGAKVKYDIALTARNSTQASSLGSDDKVEVRISNDCGLTWTTLKTYTATTTISNTSQTETVDLTAYAGQVVMLGWFATDGTVVDAQNTDFFLDNIQFEVLYAENVSMSAVVVPTSGCGSPQTPISVVICNTGLNAVSAIPVKVTVNGTANVFNTSYAGTLAAGACDTLFIGTVDASAGGTFMVNAQTLLATDQYLQDNIFFNTYTFKALPAVPTVTGNTAVCEGKSATLSATTSTGSGFVWYDALGNKVGQGSTFTTPALMSSESYSVIAGGDVQEAVGEPDPTVLGTPTTSTQTRVLVFAATSDVVLDSVTIYPNTSGNITINLLSQTGATLNSAAITVNVANPYDAVRVGLGFSLTAGTTYQLSANPTGVGGLYRNGTGATYPYSTASGSLNITGGGAGGGPGGNTSYNYFYDWLVTTPGCPSDPAFVTVNVSPSPAVNLGNDTTVCLGQTLVLDATSAISGATYQWSNGATTPSLNVNFSGTYFVKVSANGCTDQDTVNVSLATMPTSAFNFAPAAGQAGTIVFAGTPSANATSIQWVFGDGTTANTTNALHTYTANGVYTVLFIVSNSCGSDTAFQSVAIINAGISADAFGAGISLFPNPTREQASLRFDAMLTDVTVTLFTADGKTLKTLSLGNIDANSTHALDLGGYAAGIYMVRVAAAEGVAHTRLTIE